MKQARAYHHGDLRASLLSEARLLLREKGVEGLSLRQLAERAGVSRTAPYHHFKDKHSLLCALAAEGFEALDRLIQGEPGEGDLRKQLAAFVQDYLDFATSQPERYELMFGRRLWKLNQPTPELRAVAYATFKRYARRIEAVGTPHLTPRTSLRIAQASWATLHGLCRLLIDGIYVDATDMQEVSAVTVDWLASALSEASEVN